MHKATRDLLLSLEPTVGWFLLVLLTIRFQYMGYKFTRIAHIRFVRMPHSTLTAFQPMLCTGIFRLLRNKPPEILQKRIGWFCPAQVEPSEITFIRKERKYTVMNSSFYSFVRDKGYCCEQNNCLSVQFFQILNYLEGNGIQIRSAHIKAYQVNIGMQK